MKKYKVNVIQTSTFQYEIEADSPAEAREEAITAHDVFDVRYDGHLVSEATSAYIDENDDCECCHCRHDESDDKVVMSEEDFMALNDAVRFIDRLSEKYGIE